MSRTDYIRIQQLISHINKYLTVNIRHKQIFNRLEILELLGSRVSRYDNVILNVICDKEKSILDYFSWLF